MIAAIGTDGVRFVVWGLGETVDEATADALEAANEEVDPELCGHVRLTAEQVEDVRNGCVGVIDLGVHFRIFRAEVEGLGRNAL